MNFTKRCCADDANLCEIVSVVPSQESKSAGFIEEIIDKNRLIAQFRKQLEKVSATGTVGAYISLKNATYVQKKKNGPIQIKDGTIKINYVDADCILPLTVENDVVIECAFAATNTVRGKEKTTLVEFLLEEGKYKAITTVFDDKGKEVPDECVTLQLGEQKPFSVMTNAEVNNIEEMAGYGLPKVYSSIPLFMAVDLCYNLLYGDLSKGDKLVFLNELLAEVKKRADGTPMLTPQQKEVFVLLGDESGKLPTEKSLVQEYNPEIRIDQITKAFELVLSLLSITFGYGSKKYTFENGQIKTATEYIGTKQDAMQELNKQRTNATDYITDIIRAAMWFANTFHGACYSLDEELSIEFDDSYVEDKQAKLESMRADALSFGEVTILKVWYLMEKYNLSEEDAKKYINYTEEPVDDLDD